MIFHKSIYFGTVGAWRFFVYFYNSQSWIFTYACITSLFTFTVCSHSAHYSHNNNNTATRKLILVFFFFKFNFTFALSLSTFITRWNLTILFDIVRKNRLLFFLFVDFYSSYERFDSPLALTKFNFF